MSPPTLRVLVLTAFGPEFAGDDSGELGRWLDGYGSFAREVSVPGAPAPVRVTDNGVGVTLTRPGPTRAAATTTACLAADALDTDDAYVLTAGVAGIAPHAGTVGSVVLADHVVCWDAKKRDGDGTRVRPWGFGPPHAFDLDPDLVAAAERAARGADLEDPPAAREHRRRYGVSPAVDPPGVTTGTTVSGADFWYGRRLARKVESLVDHYDAGTYATTECEGFATAVACDRFDALDRYLSVRAASNFDRPPRDGEADAEWRIKGPAFRNAYRAGRAVADEIAGNWGRWRDGPPVRE